MDLLYALQGLRTPFLDWLMLALTYLGDEAILIAVGAFLFWCVDKKWGYRVFGVALTALDVTILLKGVFAIPRPWVRDSRLSPVKGAAGTAEDYSFPSGHSTMAGAAYGSLCAGSRGALRWLWLLVALVVVFTRLYLGVHTPTDVTVGLAIGLAAAFGLTALVRRCESDPAKLFRLDVAATAFALAAAVFLTLKDDVSALDATSLACREAVLKEAYTTLGALLGLTVGRQLETRSIRFDEKGTVPGQLLKLVLGIAGVMALRVLLKPLLALVLPGSPVAHTIRYFFIVLFVIGVWPLTFRRLSRVGAKE